jgi:hypothetical protein
MTLNAQGFMDETAIAYIVEAGAHWLSPAFIPRAAAAALNSGASLPRP